MRGGELRGRGEREMEANREKEKGAQRRRGR